MRHQPAAVLLIVSGAIVLCGCATPKEKTAPCKHPSAQLSFAEVGAGDCAKASPVNPDRQAALAAIKAATASGE